MKCEITSESSAVLASVTMSEPSSQVSRLCSQRRNFRNGHAGFSGARYEGFQLVDTSIKLAGWLDFNGTQ